MSKTIKKMMALVIAMVMMVSMASVAMAGSITISRDETYDGSTGRTYTAYKVFDADTSLSGSNTQGDKDPTYTEDGPIAYSMALDSPWVSVLWNTTSDQATEGQIWFNVALAGDGSKYVVTPVSTLGGTEGAAIAAFLNTNKPASATGTTVTPGTAATVDNGYYLITASDGATNLTLVTTDVTIVEKNTYITTTKTTSETSYSVGDKVTYTATVSIPSDASLTDPVILHDTMDVALAFKEDVSATMDGNGFTAFSTSYDDGAEELTDECTFEIYIPVTSAVLGKSITFTYTAEVTSAATDPDTGFVNTLFGEKNGYTTTPDEVEVWTFDFDMIKVFDDKDNKNLTATFELRTDADDEDTAIALVSKTGGYIKADTDDTGTVTEFTATNGTALNFQGFKAGTYYLVETGTSTGYNLLDGPVEIKITDTSTTEGATRTISHTVSPVNALDQVEVQNHAGSVLPSTGGIGTTIFYVIGAILVIGAGIILISRRRMRAN